ncbi:MAG TPA: hypothetical protein VF199_00495 [Bacillales bacterium]
MRRIWMAVILILSFLVVLGGCSLKINESPLIWTKAVQLNLHIETKPSPALNSPGNDKRNTTIRIPNPKLPDDLQRIQLFFSGVVPIYLDSLDEPVPNRKKQGAIVGLIGQIAKAVAPNGKLTVPNPQQNLDAYFSTSEQQLQALKSTQKWKRIQSDITRKIRHLKKAQDFSINKDFDGYLQPMIDKLHQASINKNYKTYAAASKNIIRLHRIIQAAVTKGKTSPGHRSPS